MNSTLGVNDYNTTYGHTQSGGDFKEISNKKRLDVDAGNLSHTSLLELAEVMSHMTTDFGKTLIGNCKLLDKETVLGLINKQGATGLFSKQHNLIEYIEANPGWYEAAIQLINNWNLGKPTHSYITVMHKNEPKMKKNVEAGRITSPPDVTLEELDKENYLPHRMIQFSDELTRLAHYIVLGDLLTKASAQKVYKGTINGTPAMHQGKVLRAIWEMNGAEHKRFYKNGMNENSDVVIEPIDPEFVRGEYMHLGTEPGQEATTASAAVIDFSGWDGTVTADERYLEYRFIRQFYPKEMWPVLYHMIKDLAFSICVNSDGDLWIRSGQRGSGELLTSFGNTLLVAANVVRAISKILAIPAKTLLKTVAKLHYKVSNGKVKTIELTRVPSLSDGDDTVVFANSKVIRTLCEHFDRIFLQTNKIIRSGTSAGATKVLNFEDLSFCSHEYQPVLIGPDANLLSLKTNEKKIYASYNNNYKLWWLPHRKTTDILGRLRLTLKPETMNWDPLNERCVEITRSKIMSYLLMYPHMRLIRYFCLMLVMLVGDGSMATSELLKRWPELDQLRYHQTFISALRSVYGVSSLDDISFVDYRVDHNHLKDLQWNLTYTKDKVPKKYQDIVTRFAEFSLNFGINTVAPIGWDTKFYRWYLKSLAILPGFEEKIMPILESKAKMDKNLLELLTHLEATGVKLVQRTEEVEQIKKKKLSKREQQYRLVYGTVYDKESRYYHKHECDVCHQRFMHGHRYTSVDHAVEIGQCPNPSCPKYGDGTNAILMN
uniref:Polyprotein n=1 Tax=Neuropteran flavi-related virus TaxID=2822564 RepID=A0A8A6RKK3_9FLAV|nr:polyprotein [Neuropteran flavi-related virus]